jgi:SMC interacting uncharacterized protein involved in chromosome segregation
MEAHNNMEERLKKIEKKVITLKTDQHRLFDDINGKMDNLLHKMDAAWTENTGLCEAYHASREETAALKVAVDTLMQKLNENIAITVPPSLIYLFIYFSLTLATVRLWRGLQN